MIGIAEISAADIGCEQIRIAEIGALEDTVFEIRAGELCFSQIGVRQIETRQILHHQIGLHRTMLPAQIARMLFEDCDKFIRGHGRSGICRPSTGRRTPKLIEFKQLIIKISRGSDNAEFEFPKPVNMREKLVAPRYGGRALGGSGIDDIARLHPAHP